jgi:peptidoglycan/xylan/chitin deacetylase (PgdA/CDA1 family)
LPSPSPQSDRAYPPTLLGATTALVAHGSRAHPVIAITIDDGFSNAVVLADLAILERAHVNATWFPIGHVAAAAPQTWRRVATAGLPIANHTYDHANLTEYTYARIVADIEQDNTVVS